MMYEKQGLYVDEAHLESFAENYARHIRPQGVVSGKPAANELRRTLSALDALHDAFALKWADLPATPGAVRWLLDNRWMLQREGMAAARELAHAGQLRATDDGTVLQALCTSLLRTGRGEFSDRRLLLYLRGFQKTLILEREELLLLSAGLKWAVLSALETLYRSLAADEGEDAEREAARLFGTLRELSTRDLSRVTEQADLVEQALRADPAGVYPQMSDRSRAYYRLVLSRLARRCGLPEHSAARKLLRLAEQGDGPRRHVGWWLLRDPLGKGCRQRKADGYIAANVLLTLFLSLLAGFLTRSMPTFFLLLIPVSELITQAENFLLLHLTRPVHLPRLALEGGVPDEGRTLCVTAALLTDADAAARLARAMEETRLLNRDAGNNLLFALLADLPEHRKETSSDAAAQIAAAAQAVDALNARYGGGFFLLTRPLQKTPEGGWAAWERKRGALLETMRYLRGQAGTVTVAAGDPAALQGIRYLIVLDSDTRSAPGAAKEMIGAMLHPLCRPVIDPARGIVSEGYGVLAPRIAVKLEDAGHSDFSRIFTVQGGTDPYGGDCSDLGMDLFGRGGFTGKGILDIDAYLAVLDRRIPEQRILSHDAVEGAFLRCGFLGDVELSDGFPGGVLPYYRRLERWVRGDWQNLIYLFGRGKGLPQLEKWRLFNSLRRALVPVMTLVSAAAGLFFAKGGLILAACAALLCILDELLLTAIETMTKREEERNVHYRSAVFVGLGGGLMRAFLRLLLLPGEAWVCFSGMLRALWRMTVSHRKLLEWQTADESERLRSGLGRCFRALWFAPALGVLLAAFAPGIVGKTVGLLWILTPLSARLLSLPAEAPLQLSAKERDYLLGCARDTWRYFAEHLTAREHYLPPDNVQARPPVGAARRTSPTNVGMALLAVLSALELGLTDEKDALRRITGCLDTLEHLEKWHGHFYNWYDTTACAPMEPRYVSTVDSGNLCACLIALRGALERRGAAVLAARAGALADAMDFAPLYDSECKLFYVGLDLSRKTPPDARYDLLASEARLSAYLAVARGDVPRVLWRRLSRAQKQYRGYRGMASWTGTMFEYLMPELLLPQEKNSLLWESARFCLFVQRRRVRGMKLPWGCSESAYAALDPGMSYRYKAHGCSHLALKRGMDRELVISPYSSFLALSVRPHAAIANLRRLEAMGMRDRMGFWEALDCSPGRADRVRRRPRIVRCVMAHHAGMSLAAAANLLTGGALCRYFLADPAMSAYTGLLQERVPVGSGVLRAQEQPPERGTPPAAAREGWKRSGEGTDFRRPACCLLASETYSLLLTESGISRPRWGAIAPYVSPRSPLDREKGVELFWETTGACVSLLPDAYGTDAGARRWQFSTKSAAYSFLGATLRSTLTVSLPEDDVGERRTLRLENAQREPVSGTLLLRFRPLLARAEDYDSHPAFCALGVSAKVKNGCLLLRRLARGKTRELWMCLAPSEPCSYDLSPGADSGRSHAAISATEAEYFLTDPLVTASCRLTLIPGKAETPVFALGLAYSEADALESALRICKGADCAELPCTAATVIGMDPAAVEDAFAFLPALCFPTAPAGSVRQEALWPFGISGDLPILCARYGGGGELPRAKALMDAHLFLSGCGCDFDLVFLSRDGADYHRPLHTALSDALYRAGGELLRDAKGGVHLVEDDAAAAPIAAACALDLSLRERPSLPARDTGWRAALPARRGSAPRQSRVRTEFGNDGRFQYYVNHSLPPRAWQNMLTNGRLGYLATDCGTGHLWQGNAREMQLTPWRCQPSETEGPERIWLQSGDGTRLSLFAQPDGAACRVTCFPGAAVWEKNFRSGLIRTTAFVPADTDARVLIVELAGLSEAELADLTLHWQMELLLAGTPADARFCRTAALAGGLSAENVRGSGAVFSAYSGVTCTGWTCDRAAALALDYNGVAGRSGEPVFAMRLKPTAETILVCGCAGPEALRALTRPETARAALEKTRSGWQTALSGLSVRTPAPAMDRLMNGWCAYQALACRVMGRCSIYQSGGAYGFRDQLQDTVNLIGLDPAPARTQILRSCTRQYAEGDVQHWWHELDGVSRGLRSRCSDDLLWLPWAVCEYAEKTGDLSLCGEQLPYLASPVLADGERDRYEAATVSDVRENVLRHCVRALERVMARGCGAHGLLRMGSGDWNDGFDAVGGESQWLSWFFLHVARRFGALCDRLGTEHDALDHFSAQLAQAANAAWDGDWYLRGYYADGSPLGSRKNAECRIDSIAQSWAVLSGCADGARAGAAVGAAVEQLFDKENGLVRLFTPPFAGEEAPGYISAYGPGFRENGGQYTHGALWLVMALLELDRTDEAWELLAALLPGDRDPARYLCEPFVLAADVYSALGHEGEGGWSWYTGSAGWLWRIVTEELLGLRLRDGLLELAPRLPAAWPGCSIRYRGHDITVEGKEIRVDGTAYHGGGIG